MEINIFDGDDKGYLDYIQENVDAFVLNVDRSAPYHRPALHRSSCSTIIQEKHTDRNSPFTGQARFKVCSGSISILIQWLEKEFPEHGDLRICSTCSPPPPPKKCSTFFPEEISDGDKFTEGASKLVRVNRYERDSKARQACINHFGAICQACKLNFKQFYGAIGEDFLHVHHIIPLSEVNNEYIVDPVKDLIPVCPNCHAMLHTQKPPLTSDELETIITQQMHADRIHPPVVPPSG